MPPLPRLALLSLLIGLLGTGAYLSWTWFTLPDPSILARNFPIVRPQGAGNEPIIRFSSRRPPTWVRLGAISPHARAAILISEDGKFYSHNGVDIDELTNAVKKDLRHLEFKRGASTITQQLVKNIFLSRKKSILRKFQELILTFRVEEMYSKEKILEIYLNVIEFGPSLHGIGPAAHFYFQKPASALTAKESTFLAMLLPSPVRYSSSFREKELSEYAKKIMRMLLKKMVILNHLTSEEAEAEWETPLSFEIPRETDGETLSDSDDDEDEDDGDDDELDSESDPVETDSETPSEPADTEESLQEQSN